jgi:uncharacterized protein (TIGR02217 family)
LHGFRYKDWADHKSALPSQAITATDQQIGTGTGSLQTFQLAKRYTSGAQTWVRTIAKPVAGAVRVALGMVEQMSGWTVDTTTGVVNRPAGAERRPDTTAFWQDLGLRPQPRRGPMD